MVIKTKLERKAKQQRSRVDDLSYRLNDTIIRSIEIFVVLIAILIFCVSISVLINNWKGNVPSGILYLKKLFLSVDQQSGGYIYQRYQQTNCS